MNTTTLSDLILRCRERADKVGSAFVTDAEITRLINVKFSKLWSFLSTQYTDMLTPPPVTLTVTSGQEWITLPEDFMLATAVFGISSGTRIRMKRFNMQDFPENVNDIWTYDNSRVEPLSYRIQGRRLYLRPENPSITSVELWYVPTCPVLSNTYDLVLLDLPTGWEECIVNGVAALIKMKEEADFRPFTAMEEQCYAELSTYAANRDAALPAAVVDVRED